MVALPVALASLLPPRQGYQGYGYWAQKVVFCLEVTVGCPVLQCMRILAFCPPFLSSPPYQQVRCSPHPSKDGLSFHLLSHESAWIYSLMTWGNLEEAAGA